jgi:predicted transcriptional regulator
MIETLISSKTRIKLLLKFFLNSETTSYLRHLESEFGESTNAIRLELNKLEEAGMLNSQFEGNKKIYQANKQHQRVCKLAISPRESLPVLVSKQNSSAISC